MFAYGGLAWLMLVSVGLVVYGLLHGAAVVDFICQFHVVYGCVLRWMLIVRWNFLCSWDIGRLVVKMCYGKASRGRLFWRGVMCDLGLWGRFEVDV